MMIQIFQHTIAISWLTIIHSNLCDGFTPQNNLKTHHVVVPPISSSSTSTSTSTRRSPAVSSLHLSLDSSSSSNSNNMNEDNFNTTQLSNRIQQVKQSESKVYDRFTSGLHQRVQELQSASEIEEQLDEGISFLPVITLDALLPNQKLEGSTEDPTFIQLLMDVGLGGWFVMTSLEFRSRKIRRNGVLCKIEFLDAAKKRFAVPAGSKSDKHRIPTSVDFVIAGKRRCRVVGKHEALRLRVGRWRRTYDENGEEVLLGWGEERFIDLPKDVNLVNEDILASRSDASPPLYRNEEITVTESTQWSMTEIECNLDQNEIISQEMIQKAETLIPLIDEWYDLASSTQTYHNVNVTATTRIQRNQPILSVEPDKLLLRVLKELGERPPVDDPNAFAFWAAALINPLPALGVSFEIRGKILEAIDVEERLRVLEFGLVRSIQNLKGERPL